MTKCAIAFFILIYTLTILQAEEIKEVEGKKVFETYCWGCHHQTAVAFGPSFSQIAAKRNEEEIRAMITDPASVSKVLGYKRNAMPAFKLSEKEMTLLTAYILSFKEVDPNVSKEKNSTKKVEDTYPNIATNKDHT